MAKILRKLIFTMLMIQCYARSMYKFRTCECVSFALCDNESEITYGAGMIDKRINLQNIFTVKSRSAFECENVLEICCEPANILNREEILKLNKFNIQRECGMRNEDNYDFNYIMNQKKSKEKFGESSWTVAILQSNADGLDVYQCSGSLIHPKVVLTSARCVRSKKASELIIRAGGWRPYITTGLLHYQERGVEAIVIHENHDSKLLLNDFALLFLEIPVKMTKNVNIICLPASLYEFDEKNCLDNGLRNNEFGKDGQCVSILPERECQNSLRKTRLGRKYKLDESFVCGASMSGENACKGNGGSPLVCPLKLDPKRFVQVGIVSWGIGCGIDSPRIYASLTYAIPWIDKQIMLHNLDNSFYKHNVSLKSKNF